MAAHQGGSVCVCIAAYNAQATIGRAVVSALQQAHVSEVIVVDDASADATAEVARQCDDGSGRLSVFVLERNGGPSTARNKALSESRAEFFCVLDSDDYFLPGRIERLLSADSGDWDLLADDILIVPEHPSGAHASEPPDKHEAVTLDLATFVLSNVSHPRRPRAELGFLKPLVRRRFLDAHDLRYDPGLRLGEDYALYVRALMAGAKFKVVGFCGYIAVERTDSLSSVHGAADLAGIRAFDTALSKAPGLSVAARQALAAHQRSTTNRWVLARALEMRREQGVAPALRFLVRQPASACYVASEVLRAKLVRLRRSFIGGTTVRQPRRLIGQRPINAR